MPRPKPKKKSHRDCPPIGSVVTYEGKAHLVIRKAGGWCWVRPSGKYTMDDVVKLREGQVEGLTLRRWGPKKEKGDSDDS